MRHENGSYNFKNTKLITHSVEICKLTLTTDINFSVPQRL